MKPAIKRAWIKALRSGKYRQWRKRLRTKRGFCCLGVLCDLHRKAHKHASWGKTYKMEGWYLPNVVQRWAGLYALDPLVGSKTLTMANDELKLNFKKIADLIEKHL